MASSLYVPPRSTPDGNVIPVRQPTSRKPLGLQSARAGLRRSMAALSDLKAEEYVHLDTALAQRKDVLAYLDKMSGRRDNIYAELHALEEDDQELLGQELRELGAERETLDQEIRLMEEKLVGMRNRRRWVRDKMEDVKNQRESGLSGYRAAGRDIDAEVRELLRRPPITPLDPEAIKQSAVVGSEIIESPGGLDFLRLRPERRTAEMARSWWEAEITILERRKAQILEDREALAEGARIWSEVTKCVVDFELILRELIKSGQHDKVDDVATSHQEAINDQLAQMDSVVEELEQRLQLAEDKHWNLLICAIGAELEAFVEAQGLLRATLGAHEEQSQLLVRSSHSTAHKDKAEVSNHEDEGHNEESDNEVPADLLVSRFEEHDHHVPSSSPRSSDLPSQGAGEHNNVPPEFLAEHGIHVN
ncbi:Autophagy protein 28 [Neonectria magnoliae]|uniref:Autophagy protein 28 n=1 Tax=Neonectria magnoliae TaxID=2732573 RepID=A0ABR1HRY9_9HYPO